MEHIGYSLIDAKDNEVCHFGDIPGQTRGVPDVIRLPSGDDVHCPSLGVDYQGYKLVARWMDCGKEAAVFDGERVVVGTGRSLQETLVALAAQVRWEKETGGVRWNDHTVATDREASQPKILAEFVAVTAGIRSDPSPWKFEDGFALVTNAQIMEIASTVREHIASAFVKEQKTIEQIRSGLIVTEEAVREALR